MFRSRRRCTSFTSPPLPRSERVADMRAVVDAAMEAEERLRPRQQAPPRRLYAHGLTRLPFFSLLRQDNCVSELLAWFDEKRATSSATTSSAPTAVPGAAGAMLAGRFDEARTILAETRGAGGVRRGSPCSRTSPPLSPFGQSLGRRSHRRSRVRSEGWRKPHLEPLELSGVDQRPAPDTWRRRSTRSTGSTKGRRLGQRPRRGARRQRRRGLDGDALAAGEGDRCSRVAVSTHIEGERLAHEAVAIRRRDRHAR